MNKLGFFIGSLMAGAFVFLVERLCRMTWIVSTAPVGAAPASRSVPLV